MRPWSIALLCTLAGCATAPNPKMVSVESTTTGHCAADADCGQSQLCVDSSCHDVLPVSACSEMPVHFTTNSAAIDSKNRGELNDLAVCLRANREVRVTVAGNTDERGAAAHNEVLANQRARAVGDYLEAARVPSKQVATVAFGTRDPTCAGHDASCWKQNRRSDITASDTASTNLDDSARSKTTTDDIAKGNRRVDGTGNGSDNGTTVGK
jgi:peptidoglycan-associated lipoprotein